MPIEPRENINKQDKFGYDAEDLEMIRQQTGLFRGESNDKGE